MKPITTTPARQYVHRGVAEYERRLRAFLDGLPDDSRAFAQELSDAPVELTAQDRETIRIGGAL